MADLTELKNMVRLGKVQSVDKEKMTARVKFEDKGQIISGKLQILKRKLYVLPEKDEEEKKDVVKKTKIKFDYEQALTEKEHDHKAYISIWKPEIGEMVVCLMIPDGDGDGIILGGL